MSTAFTDRNFIYYEFSDGKPAMDGTYSEGPFSSRTVSGTVQPMTGREALAYADGSLNGGLVKVYSNERLNARTRGRHSGGFVVYGGGVYRIVDEIPYQNGVMSHWKYVASLVQGDDVPEPLRGPQDAG